MTQKLLIKKLLLIVCATGLYGLAMAQSVTGKVTNQNNSPLSGVSVQIKNTSQGVTTNERGEFSIAAAQGTTLVFTYVGYKEQEVNVSGSSLEIKLEQGTEAVLSDVVVVGYGSRKKSDVTGSVATVPAARLSNLPVSNVLQAVQGAVSGVNISSGSSAPGKSPAIFIRGLGSITASTAPLVVLDGVPFRGTFNDINPNDIESMSILKDVSSTAIYGTRGSNGVILINTKKGKSGKAIVSYKGYAGPEFQVNVLKPYNGAQYVQKNLDLAAQNGTPLRPVIWLAEEQNYANGIETDWLDLISKQGSIQSHEVSVSGGTDAVRYYVSGSYFDQPGVLNGYQYHRASVRSNLDITITKWLRIGANLSYTANNNDGLANNNAQGRSSLTLATAASPYGRVYAPDGKYEIYPMDPYTIYRSPLVGIPTQDRSKILAGTFNAEVKPGFIKGLRYQINGGYTFLPTVLQSYSGRDIGDLQGTAAVRHTDTKNWIIENLLIYTKSWKQHTIDLTALYSAQNDNTFTDSINATGFINDQLSFNNIRAASVQQASSSYTENSLVSQMFRINYGYDSRYLLTATIRRDGYSGFGADNKYANFPSVAAAWNISNESFMENIKAINSLKLRLSYGVSGNQGVPPYGTLTTLGTTQYIYNNTTATGIVPLVLGNPNLRWETTKGFNGGVDFALLASRLSGTIEVYKTETTDLLLLRQIPGISGYTTTLDNIGSTSNRGIEIELNSKNIQTPDFTWTTAVNFSANKNKVLSLYGDDKDDIGNSLFIGKPLRGIYDYQMIGVWQVGDDFTSDPTAKPGFLKFADLDGKTGISPADRTYLGTNLPDYIAGLTNTFTYKNFSLNIFLQTFQGGLKVNPLFNFADFARNINLPADVGYWTETNKSNTRPSLAYLNPRLYSYPQANSFTRLKDVTLSYNFKPSFIGNYGLNNLMFYISGRNLYTFSDWVGYDPETDAHYPNVASYVFGINLSFK